MSDQSRFAFGQNSTETGVGCPAVVASGCDPAGDVLEVAERYDDILRNETGCDAGTVPKDQAEDAWDQAIQFYRRMARDEDTPEMTKYYESLVSEAETIKMRAF